MKIRRSTRKFRRIPSLRVPTGPNKDRMGLRMGELMTTRCVRYPNLTATVAAWAGSYDFRLNSLPNYAEFTALFDAYKIWKVEVTFIPKYNVSDYSSGGAAYGIPTIYVVEDRNSVATPVSISSLCEFGNCVFRRFDKPFTYTCYPSVTLSGYQAGGGVIVDDRQKDLWVRNLYPDVAHYGIMYGIDMPVGLGDFRYDVAMKYFLKFKDVV